MSRLLATFIAASSLSAPLAHAGWSSNGGEFSRDQDNVWFIGDEPLEYCIEAAPDFGMSRIELSNLTREAFAEWKAFFQRYELDTKAFGHDGTLAGQFPDRSLRKLSLAFIEVERCTDYTRQIGFEFGLTPAPVAARLAQQPNEIGAAVRADYNYETFRTGGYVWVKGSIADGDGRIDQPWNAHRPLLKQILLHELGHVFGMRHGSTPVMSENVGDQILDTVRFGHNEQSFGRIETATKRFRLKDGDMINICAEQGGLFNIPLGWCSNYSLPRTVRDRLHVSLEGSHQVFLHVVDFANQEMILDIGDGSEPRHFPIRAPRFFNMEAWELGPGIYAKWLFADGTQSSYQRAGIDFQSYIAPFNGSIEMFGEAHAMVLGRDLTWKIFTPASGKWWTVGLGEADDGPSLQR